MGLLSSGEITSMRDAADSLLAGSCVIQRGSFSADGHGGQTVVWANMATVPCRMDARDREITTMMEGQIAGGINVMVRYTMYLKYNQDITEKDRVVYGGYTYEVSAVVADQTWIMARRAELKRLKP
jgi:SPP1 family predicted phage head-tail adaptor